MRQMMTRLKLTVNEEKTHVCRVPEQHFDFLGYSSDGSTHQTGAPIWAPARRRRV